MTKEAQILLFFLAEGMKKMKDIINNELGDVHVLQVIKGLVSYLEVVILSQSQWEF